MDRRCGERPQTLSLLQQRDDFRRERREGREAAAETGDHEEPPFRCDGTVGGEERDGHADDVAADEIGAQGPGRNDREAAVEVGGEPPAQQRAETGAQKNGDDGFQHGPVLIDTRDRRVAEATPPEWACVGIISRRPAVLKEECHLPAAATVAKAALRWLPVRAYNL